MLEVKEEYKNAIDSQTSMALMRDSDSYLWFLCAICSHHKTRLSWAHSEDSVAAMFYCLECNSTRMLPKRRYSGSDVVVVASVPLRAGHRIAEWVGYWLVEDPDNIEVDLDL